MFLSHPPRPHIDIVLCFTSSNAMVFYIYVQCHSESIRDAYKWTQAACSPSLAILHMVKIAGILVYSVTVLGCLDLSVNHLTPTKEIHNLAGQLWLEPGLSSKGATSEPSGWTVWAARCRLARLGLHSAWHNHTFCMHPGYFLNGTVPIGRFWDMY